MPTTPHPLLTEIAACRWCADTLPFPPRPVLQFDPAARLLIVGQAPGRRVHETGVPFNDPSGDRLRDWLGIDQDTFYDPRRVALLPMGFCYPGSGQSGDLPPAPACARQWRARLLAELKAVELTVVLGRYALAWHLPGQVSVSEAVADWRAGWPSLIPLPHPSPRNNRWLRAHPWFESDVLPALRERVAHVLAR